MLIFFFLFEYVIVGVIDVMDYYFINEVIQIVGGLVREFRWGKWYGLIGRYMKLGIGSGKIGQQKYYVRSVVVVIDGFYFELSEGMDVDKGDEERDEEKGDEEEEDEEVEKKEVEGVSLEKIIVIFFNKLFLFFLCFVFGKDEIDSVIRVLFVLGIVKIVYVFFCGFFDIEVFRVIINVVQIF